MNPSIEALGERKLLGERYLLVPEDEHRMLVHCTSDLFEYRDPELVAQTHIRCFRDEV